MNWVQVQADYRAVTDFIFGPLRPDIEATADVMIATVRAGGKVLFCGNGGSAADAQHFAGEFVNRFLLERRPYAGIALTTDASVLTSIGNDYGYEQIFEKQVLALGRPGDVLVAISTSGNAANVCLATRVAKAAGLKTIAMTGGKGGKLAGLADRVLSVSCTTSTPRIQEGHQLILHLICERVEEILR
ncbi:MAG: SIS domain-containing protein [Verrucomicrobia bacterium]|nr:MAG: SIS domain-containing protein [Verrucomicrobiota bacterium]